MKACSRKLQRDRHDRNPQRLHTKPAQMEVKFVAVLQDGEKMLHNSHKDGTNHAGFHNNKDTHHCNTATAEPPAA